MNPQKITTPAAFILAAVLTVCNISYSKDTVRAGDGGKPAVSPLLAKAAANGAFATGAYRNLFAEIGIDSSEVRQKVDNTYRQFFHGNPGNESVFYPVTSNGNGPMAYIKDIGNNDVRSEGMSYGMMIAVQFNEKKDFDALWNWAHTYMYHTDGKHPDYGYFSWQMREDGTKMDDNPAPDGEEYFAMALYFAAHRWGNGTGIYKYKTAADRILTDMVHRKDMTGRISSGDTTTITSLMNREAYMIRFTPNTANFARNSDHTDPSYHLPAFYELFALWGPGKDRPFWQKCARTSRDFFVKVTHPQTGLSPDYAGFDGKPVAASWNPLTADFRQDAFRTAMNWSTDAAWWAADVKRQAMLSDRLQAFFEREGIEQYKGNYTLDGKPTADYRSVGLIAMNATAGLCASHERARKFVKAFWNTPQPTGKWRYYDGMLYMFGLLHLSGNYRIYHPAK